MLYTRLPIGLAAQPRKRPRTHKPRQSSLSASRLCHLPRRRLAVLRSSHCGDRRQIEPADAQELMHVPSDDLVVAEAARTRYQHPTGELLLSHPIQVRGRAWAIARSLSPVQRCNVSYHMRFSLHSLRSSSPCRVPLPRSTPPGSTKSNGGSGLLTDK